ncbi:MAG: serine/threonine-protein kinase [Gemmatimonadota bacterium]|nr:serine/threonine-protein kinase [Gemmatimonadota bacterium]
MERETRARGGGTGGTSSTALPGDLLGLAARRLQVVALVYSAVFFFAAIAPNAFCLLIARSSPEVICHGGYFTTPRIIGPPVLAIAAGLAMFVFARWGRATVSAKLRAGLVFQVLGSFAIALSEYQGVVSAVRYAGMEQAGDSGGFGLSWVAPWVMLFTVIVPARPRRAVAAAVASVSAVPISFGLYRALGINTVPLGPVEYFFALVFPYILVATMAGIAAHVVYGLGREVRRAREVGSYRVVERLGAGGMGEVWRADHRFLARPAAVKLIRPEALGMHDPVQRRVTLERFEREAQATAGLRSPHTVELYDFGVADDGTLFYVMELLDGFDLDAIVKRFGALPAGRVVHLLRQACHSLGEAHEAGLVHRDIKPANLYACRLGRDVDRLKVLDFGMVKRRSDAGPPDAQLTDEQTLGGTPAWMAPEQAMGDPVDGRTDLYALGCVGYWLLTGTPVFEGRTAVEMLTRHVREVPSPPGSRCELPVPAALDEAILACLAKHPDDRPASADELGAMLAGVAADPPWTPERARAWWDLHAPRSGETGGGPSPRHGVS